MKRNKIKKEKLESSSRGRSHEEHDLAYYIHDRVELMHQVFSILKYKELKTIAPECVRNLTIGDLQELCTEELLGISSKRLLAILDGAEPPSDTESSSSSPPPEELETISLDSISSDEELLNANQSKKKKKHKHHNRRNSKKKDKVSETEETTELSKASRAGLTVLELLELQARARAIRAQLQQEQIHKNVQETPTVGSSHHSSDNEVEIKEEPPDVVEISSEDEKPDINQLNSDSTPAPNVTSNMEVNQNNEKEHAQTVTKRVHDLIITVPQAKTSRKIKLNRNNSATVSNINNTIPSASHNQKKPDSSLKENVTEKKLDDTKTVAEKTKELKSKKKKKYKKKKIDDKDGSDHDEITLQLSDTEKMDLFENFDESRKNYDKVSSSSEDSETSSSDSDDENSSDGLPAKNLSNDIGSVPLITIEKSNSFVVEKNNSTELGQIDTVAQIVPVHKSVNENSGDIENNTRNNNILTEIQRDDENNSHCSLDVKKIDNECIISNKIIDSTPEQNTQNESNSTPPDLNNFTIETRSGSLSDNAVNIEASSIDTPKQSSENEMQPNSIATIPVKVSVNDEVIEVENTENLSCTKNTSDDNIKQTDKKEEHEEVNMQPEAPKSTLSDGELSDRESSEVEAMDVRPEIVCISDEESNKMKGMKKKKKKEKKSKKSKKSKPDCDDQNLCRDTNKSSEQELRKGNVVLIISNESTPGLDENKITEYIDLDSDEVCEIFELSDDSSCSEIEGSLLSKEPTAEEIEALSAKIDEIKREEVVTDEQIKEHEKMLAEKAKKKEIDQNIENISWRDRYLDSNKVKKVLTTANIFNALRKKNKELKNKIELSKKKRDDAIVEEGSTKNSDEGNLEEGSIEQYNTLEGLTKYVDPVTDPNSENVAKNEDSIRKDENVTREMKKDAKQLLKMYRRLLKYNDVNKQADPAKKKKKKHKKKPKQDLAQKNVVD